MTRLRLALIVIVVIAAAAAPGAHTRRIQTTAAGSISGTVVNDARPAAPVRRAIVTVTNVAGGVTRTTTTDDSGRFGFDTVATGRYTVTAAKGGYVTSMLGATRPGGTGVAEAVPAGAHVTDLLLTLVRGAVITGTLRDARGTPIADTRIYAAPPGTTIDDRIHAPDSPSIGTALTDDRGAYRIFGLRPGTYVVYAPAPLWVEVGITRVTTPEDVRRAQDLIGAGVVPVSALATFDQGARSVNYADTYYPGTTSPADALPLHVAAGEERGGMDLVRQLMPTARLTGEVRDVTGQRLTNPRVWIRPAGSGGTRQQFELTVGADGVFEVPHVLPGEYLIGAEGRTPTDATKWARLNVSVHGVDQPNLVLTLQPGFHVSGRLEFEPGSAPPPDRPVQIYEAGQRIFTALPSAKTSPDGTFTIDGVAPGRYQLSWGVPNGRDIPAGWRVKSITGAGPDAADVPLDVHGDVSNLVITLTTSTTELTGVSQDVDGNPVATFTVIAFCTDQALWVPQSRRIQAARPGSDGRYTFKNLPAGDYYLAAVADVDDGAWFDRSLLTTLAAGSMRVRITDGGRTVQNLKVLK